MEVSQRFHTATGLPAHAVAHLDDDIAAHHQAADPGPAPLVRALVGLLVGAAVGLLTVAGTRPSADRHG